MTRERLKARQAPGFLSVDKNRALQLHGLHQYEYHCVKIYRLITGGTLVSLYESAVYVSVLLTDARQQP